MLPREREVLREVLRMYKEHPVLWDRKHPQYMMQDVRDKTFGLLLDKYRTLAKDATAKELKRRIENIRTNHRREYRKMLESKARGDNPCRKSSLWYFGTLMFLENDFFNETTNSLDPTTDYEDDEEDSSVKLALSSLHNGTDHQAGESLDENAASPVAAAASDRRTVVKMLPQEKELLEEVLKMYKEHTVLWDKNHPQYYKQDVRDRTLGLLLDKYRTVYKDATVKQLKKRIENMRANHRREYRKVLKSKARGDAPCYTPTLWYYDILMFIHNHSEDAADSPDPTSGCEDYEENSSHQLMPSSPQSGSDYRLEMAEDFIDENDFSDHDVDAEEHDAGTRKRRELSTGYIADEGNKRQRKVTKSGEQASSSSQESKAFGNTVGLQLKALDGFQRTVAEKLISEVIFYARLNKLSAQSEFKLNAYKYH